LPGFSSHGRGLPLGAGCRWRKLLDAKGTQPPLCDEVVNFLFCLFVLKLHFAKCCHLRQAVLSVSYGSFL